MGWGELEGKTWEELSLMMYKKVLKLKESLDEKVDDIDKILWYITCGLSYEDLKDYFAGYDKNIHFPSWNRYPDKTPNELLMKCEEFIVFTEPDYFEEAQWKKDGFYTRNEHRENEKLWDIEPNVKFWIPLIFPGPY